MRFTKRKALVIAAGAWITIAHAQSPISIDALPGAGSLTGTELFPAEQNGAAVSATTNQLRSYSISNLPAISLSTVGSGGITNVLQVPNGGIGTTTLSGLLRGNGTAAISAATFSDVQNLFTGCISGTFLGFGGICSTPTFNGVTSVSFSAPSSLFTTTVSPSTGAASIILGFQSTLPANEVFATPNGSTGAPLMRALVGADLPAINLAVNGNGGATGTLPVLKGGTGSNGLTGLLVGNGTAPVGTALASNVSALWGCASPTTMLLRADGNCVVTPAGSMTSVALSASSPFTVGGSPLTGSGGTITLGLSSGAGNEVLATPSGGSGPPALRSLVSGDIPAVNLAAAGNGGVVGLLQNSSLQNPSLTLNGASVSLGGSRTLSLASSDYANQGTVTTVLHGNGSGSPSFGSVNLVSDVTGNLGVGNLNSGTGASSATCWHGNATWGSCGGSISAGSPSATIGLTPIVGATGTYMDAGSAPALSPNISPFWTGTQSWGGIPSRSIAQSQISMGVGGVGTATPSIEYSNANAPANQRIWEDFVDTNGTYVLRASNDAYTTFQSALNFTKTGTSLLTMSFGNPTDSPTYQFLGNSATVLSGGLVSGTPLGGYKGVGSINMQSCFVNNTACGSVINVGLSLPSIFSVTTPTVSTSGTLTASFATGQPADQVLASPVGSTGAVSLRALVGQDIPATNLAAIGNGGVFGNLPVTNLNSGSGASATTYWSGNGTWSTPGLNTSISPTLTGNWAYSPVSGPAITITAPASTLAASISGPTEITNVGLPLLVLNSAGTRFGLISNPSGNLWSLGYGSSTTAAGTSVLAWNATGNVTIAVPTAGNALSVTGLNGQFSQIINGSSTGVSHGLFIDAGIGSSDIAFDILNQAETLPILKVTGDGGVQVGNNPSGGSKGSGTINVTGGYFVNGVAVGTGGSPGGSTTQFQFNNGGSFGGASAATYNTGSGLVTLSDGMTVTGTAFNYAITAGGVTTTGQSFGEWVEAGTNSSDESFIVTNSTGATGYMSVRGDGDISMPHIQSSTSAQTGTLCWSSSHLTYDPSLGCLTSSMRFKTNIDPLDAGLLEIMRLRPVSYDIRPQFNAAKLGRQVGLIAEEVGTVDPRLIGLDNEGKPLGVRYQQLTAVLVKSIQQQQEEILVLWVAVTLLGAWCGYLTVRRK